MQELTKVFNGEPLRIEMIDEDKMEFWVDISGVALKNKKKISDYTKRDSFKNRLRVREKSQSEVLLNIGQTVKIHSCMLINFATWVNDEFGVWCEDFIFDYLIQKRQDAINGLSTKQLEIENKYAKQISDLKCKVNEKTQHKLITYRDNTQSLRKWVQDKFPGYEIKEKDLWRFLENHRDEIVTEVPARSSRKILKNLDLGKEVGSSIAFNEDILVYISEFVGETNLTKKPQQGKFEF